MSDHNPPEQGSFGSPPPPPPIQPTQPLAPAPPLQPATPAPAVQPTQPSAAQAAVQSGAAALSESSAGFLPALFDFSFTTFVTPKIVRFVYVLATIWAVLMYLLVVVTQFSLSALSGLVALVLGPLVAVIWLAVVRIGLEFGLSVVRMSEDIHRRLPQG